MTVANTEHVEAAQNLLRGFPKMAHIDSISTITNLVSTFKAAGLVNVAATDLALRDKNVPWYRPLESHQNSRSNSPLSLSWWYGQLSIATLLTAGRLRVRSFSLSFAISKLTLSLQIFSPMVLVTGEKSTKCL